MTWLQRSLNVAARFLAPCSFTGFRRPALARRISPSGWGLLPGAPALTRTDLSSARTTRLSGRTMFNYRTAKEKVAETSTTFLDLRFKTKLRPAISAILERQ